MKYSIEDLNNVRLNIVCYITSYEEWSKLKSICDKITPYNSEMFYYLTSRGGYAKSMWNYINSSDIYGEKYRLIKFDDFIPLEEIVFDNGVPFTWEDDI
jgi:hypothetical protein